MNDFAKRWVAALRSGEYKQCTIRLRRQNTFCVFGVACDLMKDSFTNIEDHSRHYSYDGHFSSAPSIVIAALGLRTTTIKKENHYPISLYTLNDRGTSLAEIADYIEQYQDQLFED